MKNFGRLEILSAFISLALHGFAVGAVLTWNDSDKNSTRLISVKVFDVAATNSPNQKLVKEENDNQKNSNLEAKIKDDGGLQKKSKKSKPQKERSAAQLTSGNFAKNSSKINSAISKETNVNWLKSPTPIYPPKARMLGWQGKVLLSVVIAKTGKVKDAKIIKSSGHQLLDDSALQAIWLWEIAPDSNDLESAIFEVPIAFELQGY